MSESGVVIVGGGMVGVTLALLMAKAAPTLPVTLLEAARLPPALAPGAMPSYTPSFDARNTALSRRSIEAFKDLGVWPQLAPHATPIHQIHVSDKGHFGMARLTAAEEHVDSFGYVVENAWLGAVLLAALRQCPSVTLIDGVQVTEVTSTGEMAQVRYRPAAQMSSSMAAASDPSSASINAPMSASDDITLTTPLLIAADGAQSQSRAWLGVDVRSQPYGQTAIVTACETSLPHAQVAFERFTADGPIALLPLPDQPDAIDAAQPGCRRSLVWALSDVEAARVQALDDAGFMQALQQAFGRRAGRFRRVGQRHAYPLALMVASQQVQGRAVILGNAAHSLHPVAGQGYNLCVRDALVLSAQLAEAHQQGKDLGDAGDLATYAAAREQDQSQIIRFSDSLVRGFSTAQPLVSWLRNVGLVGFDVLPGAKPALARYAMGLSHV